MTIGKTFERAMSHPSTPPPADYLLTSLSERDRLYLQFDQFRGRFRDAFARALELAQVGSGPFRVLDVACGEGLYAADIVEHYPGATVVGLDRDAEAIATARAAFSGGGRLAFHVMDVHSPLIGTVGGSFDIALLQCALAHFKNAPTALHNVFETLRPGAAICLLDPAERNMEYPHPSMSRLAEAVDAAWRGFGTYAAGDLHEQLLRATGFVDIVTEPQNYVIGGPTREGQQHFVLVVELLRSMRSALVERARTIDAREFEEQLEALIASNDRLLEGKSSFQLSIARRPV
jgi:SAM-dependent methyltransferase